MRIVYGVQSTGKGHLSRFLGLMPFFVRDRHELLVIASGYETPPPYFYRALEQAGHRWVRCRGMSYVTDGAGSISKRRTVLAFLKNLPRFLDEFGRVQELITGFGPDLIVTDFEPVCACPLLAPAICKVGLSNQNVLMDPAAYHPGGLPLEKLFTYAVVHLFTDGATHRLGCHFYPVSDRCLPPIIREAILDARVENRGHMLVYHTLAGMLGEVERYAASHPDRRIIVYGYQGRADSGNMHFEHDPSKFPQDLASADVFVGTAGFQSISEAFYLGKKIAVRPVTGQYEQTWNAAQLEHYSMGCWYGRDPDAGRRRTRGAGPRTLEEAVDHPFNAALHARLAPWFRDGARMCYEGLIGLAGR